MKYEKFFKGSLNPWNKHIKNLSILRVEHTTLEMLLIQNIDVLAIKVIQVVTFEILSVLSYLKILNSHRDFLCIVLYITL